jgi:hypothetical protein
MTVLNEFVQNGKIKYVDYGRRMLTGHIRNPDTLKQMLFDNICQDFERKLSKKSSVD